MVSYGHSWIAGDGATTAANCLVQCAARRLGFEPENRGVGGSLSTATATLLVEDPPPPASVYVVMTGLNDLRFGGESAESLERYSEALDSIFSAFHRADPDAAIVAVEQPHLVDFRLHAPYDRGSNELVDIFNEELRSVAATHRRVVVAEVEGWDSASMLDPDTVHPNDAGHNFLADVVTSAMMGYFVSKRHRDNTIKFRRSSPERNGFERPDGNPQGALRVVLSCDGAEPGPGAS
ncbi:SGNH/GDSL hydrolase family protein [Pseudarthrobacter sp. SSS035]|uniref:SGNH/GDSL hydrolase family protein n=1 Tax=Pseudarthrobacter sp. SSS035 TaxID=2931399 RepID=UPI00200F7595|nr:SGNH/GDSL hydrolase family protein [Pseudarthrobacter sp. SSS035]